MQCRMERSVYKMDLCLMERFCDRSAIRCVVCRCFGVFWCVLACVEAVKCLHSFMETTMDLLFTSQSQTEISVCVCVCVCAEPLRLFSPTKTFIIIIFIIIIIIIIIIFNIIIIVVIIIIIIIIFIIIIILIID
ncbi:hypothetical protein QTP70_005205 [Hemibagrus guttatus]|uniref:Transmembrane protein n=1 Tax=Hemibagrus guttatus TaxID=175788 RepID=A0AAE0R8U0_9TELE|nr:hypothetical protein QTP70_005205 [Hemibagrus guttatus]